MVGLNLLSVFAVLALTVLSACNDGSTDSRSPEDPSRYPGTAQPYPSPIDNPIARRPTDQPGLQAPVPKSSCRNEPGWHYCVHKYAGNNPAILYYVHSYTDSHYGWMKGYTADSTTHLYRLQALLGENSPTVVVISYVHRIQDSWMLSANDYKSQPPHLATVKHFTTQAMPLIEKRFRLKGPRTVYGFSMGGFNAAQLCLNAPHLWSKCIIQNALLVMCDPFSKPEWTRFFCLPGFLIRKQFTPEEWKENDPLMRVEQIDATKLPKILVTNAREDQFNLYEAGRHFALQLEGRGARVKWHPINGEHSDFDAKTVAEFIMSE